MKTRSKGNRIDRLTFSIVMDGDHQQMSSLYRQYAIQNQQHLYLDNPIVTTSTGELKLSDEWTL